ncbi:Neuronal acetylcholine receptor subunit alpha-7 [Mizuhopecten yessoensis]|uniref:Neuronal acetylcholine receptor subunit alpha-7 n=2 Tax=Mizuhopecten yessoensis TaxID=6573 RepID=A0A210QRX3_MIZYE|nr:Neuronal acetylcholine receptor subunit alpha-7 [Mizuhopecten yessoensis]
MNPFEKIEPPGFDRQKVGIYNSGLVIWGPDDVYEVTCQADVTFYPFDQQKCSLFFGLYMVTLIDVIIETFSDDIQTDFYYPNGIWALQNTTCEVYPVMNSPTLAVTIEIKRRPMFQVINTIVPFSVLGLLNVLVFLLPAESGERVGFTVTVLLAIAVFMSIVTETLPGASEPSFPRLCYLLAAELCINALVTVCTILISRLNHKPKHETVPFWLQYISCKCICYHAKKQNK